jgi:pimeloyl-ACP methyl ester carboxylesterase
MRAMWALGAHLPGLVRLYARLVQRATGSDEASTDRYLLRYADKMGPADAVLLRDPQARRSLARVMAESFRQGPNGNLDTVLVETRAWGFAVELVAFERLYLWHGEQDRVAPAAAARLMAQALPHCAATFYPAEGHFSTVMHHAQTCFRTLRGDSNTMPAPPVSPNLVTDSDGR